MSGNIKKIFNKIPWSAVGLAAALLLIIPYMVLGHGVYIQMNDQLDGEVLNYIYGAKYLFSGSGIIPELMNGASTISMTPPAPVGLIFYRVLSPFAAFAVMHAFVIAVGYIGMYLLSKELTDSSFISFITAGLFVYLPFYPVYGLSIPGQPLLVWALIRIYKTNGRKIGYYFPVVLYAVSSSFALVGFAWMAVIAITCIYLAIKAVKYRGGNKNNVHVDLNPCKITFAFCMVLVLMTAVYVLCNINLVKDMLGIGDTFVSHREEMIIASLDFVDNFCSIFFEGGSYAKSYNMPIFILAVIAIVCGIIEFLTKKFSPMTIPVEKIVRDDIDSDEENKNDSDCKTKCMNIKWIVWLLVTALVISIIAALWRVEPVAEMRMNVGGTLKSFQADRIYWLLPVCWYMILALSLKQIGKSAITALGKFKAVHKITGVLFGGIVYAVTAGLLVFLGFNIYENSTIYHNLRLMIFPDTYHLMNWDDYYAEDVYAQIDDYIGVDKSTYRTVSLGITPAAALYNGFYCLDGYSNFYPLEYKHEFRKVIADELEKSEELRVYFDSWGNRCYLFNGETGNYMMIPGSNGGSYEHLDLNTDKLYEMGCRYIFAALPIDNAADMNLILMRDEPFATDASYYHIWLYAIQR
jgi:hypothetical protein